MFSFTETILQMHIGIGLSLQTPCKVNHLSFCNFLFKQLAISQICDSKSASLLR